MLEIQIQHTRRLQNEKKKLCLKSFSLNKHGNVAMLQSLGMGIIIFGVTIGIGAYVIGQVNNKLDNSSRKVTGNTTNALIDMASWLGILVIAAIGGIAIWFMISYIGGTRR